MITKSLTCARTHIFHQVFYQVTQSRILIVYIFFIAMAIQRHNVEGKENPKKAKKGISVGPGNLPDGTHLRKGI